jgi:hypothetical protein
MVNIGIECMGFHEIGRQLMLRLLLSPIFLKERRGIKRRKK